MIRYSRRDRNPWRGGHSIGYSYYADRMEKGRPQEGVELEVYHSQERPLHSYTSHINGTTYHDDREYKDINKEKDGQMELFRHIPAEISYLRADPSMRIPAMNLVARAMLDTPNLVADSSLSPHSSRLVKKGMKLGVIKTHPLNPDAEVNNDLELNRYSNYDSMNAAEIPREGMKQASNHLRSILRPERAKPLNTGQFQPQLPIFGMPNAPK